MRTHHCLAAIAATLIVVLLGAVPASAAGAPPVAVADQFDLKEDASAAALGVLDNDTDSDGGEMTIESVGTAGHGTVAIAGIGSGLTFAPTANYCGSDSFEYTLNGGSFTTVTVTIACVDDPPTAVADMATVEEDGPATSIPVLGNDTDIDAGPKSILSVGGAGHGVTAVTGGGTGVTYEPYANYCGSDAFSYRLNGGSTSTVTVDVACYDDLPRGVDDEVTLREDDPATELPVLDNDPDIDPGEKAIESATPASHGTIQITGDGSILIYKPDPGYCGVDSFVYTLNGNATATVTIAVSCVDDQPVATDDSVTVGEDADAGLVAVLANDTDPDGGPKLIVARGDADHGAVGNPGSETGLTYAPAPDYCGPDHFTYGLSTGGTATVTVTVTCVDDPPYALPDLLVIREDAARSKIAVLANDSDIDGPFAIASITQPHHGRATIQGARIDYKPNHDFCGKDTFTYSLKGGARALIRIRVKCRPN